MAYDEQLADRVRDALAEVTDPGDLTERRMFGGLAFMVAGSMAVAVSGSGGLMVRVDPDDPAVGSAEPVVMRGRPMRGWVRVGADEVADDADLVAWLRRGVERARAVG